MHQMDAGTLLFAHRFSAVPTGDSIRQSKKYQIVAIKDTGKEKPMLALLAALPRPPLLLPLMQVGGVTRET